MELIAFFMHRRCKLLSDPAGLIQYVGTCVALCYKLNCHLYWR